MAIRVEYTPVRALGELAQAAGQAQAQEAAAARAQQLQLQSMQSQAAMQRQLAAQQHQREMEDFKAFLALESEKRARAWQLEKIEMASRHDFDMLEKRKEMYWAQDLQQRLIKEQETLQKLKALDDAAEQGVIPPAKAAELKLQVRLGMTPRWGEPTSDPYTAMLEEALEEILGEKPTESPEGPAPKRPGSLREVPQVVWENIKTYWGIGTPSTAEYMEGVPQHVQEAGELRRLASDLDPESQQEVANIIASNNPEDIHCQLA